MFLEFYQLVFRKILICQLLPHLPKDSRKLECSFGLVMTPLVSILKDQVEELARIVLRVFAISLGDQKGEKELVASVFHVDLLYRSPETSSKQRSDFTV